jgi:LysM repeat protein
MEGTTTNPGARGTARLMVTRVLAVLAVAAAAIALYLVISGSLESSEKGHGDKGAKHEQHQKQDGEEVPETYTVLPGDTAGAIAVKFGLTEDELAQLNPKTDLQVLQQGQVLNLR